jgi:hypothetical protein
VWLFSWDDDLLAGVPKCCSELIDQLAVGTVRTDPEPQDGIILPDAQSSPADANSDRIDRPFRVDSLESETWMGWVLLPELVIFSGYSLDLVR